MHSVNSRVANCDNEAGTLFGFSSAFCRDVPMTSIHTGAFESLAGVDLHRLKGAFVSWRNSPPFSVTLNIPPAPSVLVMSSKIQFVCFSSCSAPYFIDAILNAFSCVLT